MSLFRVYIVSNHWNLKGSYTVEAALLCPLICLVLCLMISITLELYEQVVQHGADCVRTLEEIRPPSMLLRMERAAGEIWENLMK